MERSEEFAEDVQADEQCPLCDGPMFIHDDEKVCGDCYYVSEPPKRKAMPDPWERFQRDRREWVAEEDERGGWTGPTRVKMIGGFAGPYVYGEGDSIEDRVYGQ